MKVQLSSVASKITKSTFEPLISDFGQKVRLPQIRLWGSKFMGSRNVLVGRLDYLKKGCGARNSWAGGKVLSTRPGCLSTRPGCLSTHPGRLCEDSGWVERYFPPTQSLVELQSGAKKKVINKCQNIQVSKSACLVGKMFVHSVRVVCAP